MSNHVGRGIGLWRKWGIIVAEPLEVREDYSQSYGDINRKERHGKRRA